MAGAIAQTRAFFVERRRFAKHFDAVGPQGGGCDPIEADNAEAFCMNGAFIRLNKPERQLYHAWIKVGHKTAREMADDLAADLFSFNDQPATTIDDIIRFLDQAAAAALRYSLSASPVPSSALKTPQIRSREQRSLALSQMPAATLLE